MRAVHTVVRLWNPRFLDAYTTTLGYTVYMPERVRTDPRLGARILRHERVHLDQFRRHPIWYPFSYLFVLPFGWTMRAWWETEAYVETMRAELDETGTISPATVEEIARRFWGPDYFFMDLRRGTVRRRLAEVRRQLLEAHGRPERA